VTEQPLRWLSASSWKPRCSARRHAEGGAAELQGRVAQVLDQVRALEKEVAQLKGKLASSQGDELVSQAVDVKGIKVLAARLDGADAKTLRDTMDKLKDKLKTRGHRAGGGRRRQGADRGRRHGRQHGQG
jgi:alanyl-tRNA synthetase